MRRGDFNEAALSGEFLLPVLEARQRNAFVAAEGGESLLALGLTQNIRTLLGIAQCATATGFGLLHDWPSKSGGTLSLTKERKQGGDRRTDTKYAVWCYEMATCDKVPPWVSATSEVSLLTRGAGFQYVQARMKEAYAIAWKEAMSNIRIRLKDSASIELNHAAPYGICVVSPISLVAETNGIVSLALDYAKNETLGKDVELRPYCTTTEIYVPGEKRHSILWRRPAM